MPIVAAVGIALTVLFVEALFRRARLSGLYNWDAWAFWVPKGKAIYFFGGLDEGFFTSLPGSSYPPLVPDTRRRRLPCDGLGRREHVASPVLVPGRWIPVGARGPPVRASPCLDPLALRARPAGRASAGPAVHGSRSGSPARLLLRRRRGPARPVAARRRALEARPRDRPPLRHGAHEARGLLLARFSWSPRSSARFPADARSGSRWQSCARIVVAVALPWRIWYVAHGIAGEGAGRRWGSSDGEHRARVALAPARSRRALRRWVLERDRSRCDRRARPRRAWRGRTCSPCSSERSCSS